MFLKSIVPPLVFPELDENLESNMVNLFNYWNERHPPLSDWWLLNYDDYICKMYPFFK